MVSVTKAVSVLCLVINILVPWRSASTPTTEVADTTGALPFESLAADNYTNSSSLTTASLTTSTEVEIDNPSDYCPDGLQCSDLSQECLTCVYNTSCIYGRPHLMTCTVKDPVLCEGNRTFTREFTCRYCYQVEHWWYTCSFNHTCAVVTSPPRPTYTATCTVKPDINCMGRRKFYKKLPCNWTSGYRWSTALALSITLGGLGADRFYLGLWRAGLGKLFSFGGLGVWTIVDVILVAIGYVGPSDGSVYMR